MSIILEGILLIYDEIIQQNHIFINNCNLHIPDKVPVYWNFYQYDNNMYIGNADVIKEDNKLKCKIKIINENLIKSDVDYKELYLGGYYNKIRYNKKILESKQIISEIYSADLKFIGISLAPYNPKCKVISVKEE